MQNYIESGENIEFVAAADTLAGHFVANGFINGVSKGDVLSGATGVLMTSGVFLFTKLNTEAVTAGAKCYWDNTNKWITTTVGSNKLVGYAVAAQLAADTTVKVKLTGNNG